MCYLDLTLLLSGKSPTLFSVRKNYQQKSEEFIGNMIFKIALTIHFNKAPEYTVIKLKY